MYEADTLLLLSNVVINHFPVHIKNDGVFVIGVVLFFSENDFTVDYISERIELKLLQLI